MTSPTRGLLRLLPLSAALALAVGCTYVSQSDYEEKRETIDQDEDGAPFGGPNKDCDDEDRDRAPGLPEIPYDGIDNDCNGSDIVDVDGDSHPGIAFEDWAPRHEGLEWPVSAKKDTVDCNDDDNNVFPGKGTDPPYDGIDADCDCSNDFDVDGDGDVPAEHEAVFGAYKTDVEAAGCTLTTPTFGDCDDFDPNANSGIATDACHDGVDANCDGSNDYDCDGDGYMPDSVTTSAFDQFVSKYHGGTVPSSWAPAEFGDCDDDDGSVHPTAVDTVGDGVDSDCGCNTAWDNDFDGDGDGWIPQGEGAALATYATTWCAGQLQPTDGGEGDCNDSDPAVNPGQLETLGDATDSDCSGDPDSSELTYGDLTWTNPRSPALTKTNGHYVLVGAADSFSDPPAAAFNQAGVALVFDPSSGPGDGPSVSPILFQGAGTVYPLGPAVDVAATGSEFRTAYSYSRDGLTYVLSARFVYNAASGTYTRDATDVSAVSPYTALDIDIELDGNGDPRVWAVGPDRLHILHGDSMNTPDVGMSMAVTSASTVFIDDPDLLGLSMGTVCDAASCESFTYNGTAIVSAGNQPWSADAAESAHAIDGVVALADGAAGVVIDDGTQSNVLLGTVPVIEAKAAMENGTLYVVALVDNGALEAKLIYGNPASASFTTVDIPIDAGLAPTGVGLHVDSNRVFIAVSAEDGSGDDAVGWLFLGPA